MSHPENRFIQALHRKLRPLKKKAGLYFAKLQVAGNNGFPDCWYSGPTGDLWTEYKWVSERDFPKRDTSQISVTLSKNQREWLNGRHQEGRQVCCIVGSPHGHLILHFPFPEKISVAHFMSNAVDNQQVLNYILGITLERPNPESIKDQTDGNPTHHSARSRERRALESDMDVEEEILTADPG